MELFEHPRTNPIAKNPDIKKSEVPKSKAKIKGQVARAVLKAAARVKTSTADSSEGQPGCLGEQFRGFPGKFSSVQHLVGTAGSMGCGGIR